MRKCILLVLIMLSVSSTYNSELYADKIDIKGEQITPEIIDLMRKLKDADYEVVLQDGTKYEGKVELMEKGLMLKKSIYSDLKESERINQLVSFDQILSVRVIKKKSYWLTVHSLAAIFCIFVVASVAGK